MGDNPELKLEIVLDDGTVRKAFARIQNESKNAGKKSGDDFGKAFNSSFSAIELTGANLAANAISSISNELRLMAGQSIQAYRSFSRGVAEVNSILPQNEKLTVASTEALVSYSQLYATSAQQQAKAYYGIVSAGIKGTDKQLKVLNQSNKAAIAGLVDINTSARSLVSTMNAYSQSGLSARDVSDVLFVSVREGQTTFGELADSIARVSPLAASAGLELSEMAGFLAFITKAGVTTSEAVTGLRSIIAAIVKPADEAAKFAKKLGIEFNVTALRSKGLAGFLDDVKSATKGNESQLARLFPRVQALTPVIQTVNGDFGDLKRILDETARSAGATNTAFKEIAENADFQAKQIESSYNRALQSLGKDLNFVTTTAKSVFANLFGQNARSAEKDLININKRITELQNQLRSNNNEPVSILQSIFGKNSEEEEEKRISRVTAEINRLISERERLSGILNAERDSFGPEAPDNSALEAERARAIAELQALRSAQAEYEEIARSVAPENTTSFFEAFSNQFGEAYNNLNLEDKKKQFAAFEKSMQSFAKQTKKAMIAGFASSVGNAFSAFGAALVNGENALDAFLDSFLASIGQQLVQQGTAFILQGIGWSANPATPGSGAGLIAAGTAMTVFGGALSAVAGGGAPSTTANSQGGIESGNFTNTDIDLQNDIDEERLEPETKVSINIQGDVLDSDETGLRIAKILEDASLNNNIKVLGAA